MLRSRLLDEGEPMEYKELIKKVVEDFDDADKPFPQDLMYPILVCDDNGNVSDLFMTFNLYRNKDGSIQTIGEPIDIYINDVHSNQGKVVDDIDISHCCPAQDINMSANTSIIEFTTLYMQIREFAFEEILTPIQLETLQKIVYIYDDLFEATVSDVYHKYGGVFFDWAYKLLES